MPSGSAPVIGYHYGAENTEELKSLLRKSVTLNLGSGIVMLGIAQALAMTLAHLFVGYDPALFSMTVHGFRIFTVAFVLLGLNIFFSSFLRPSTTASSRRKPHFYGRSS